MIATEFWGTDTDARMIFTWTPVEELPADEPIVVTITAVIGSSWMTRLVDEIKVIFTGSDEELLLTAAEFGLEIGWPRAW